jgi:hypothetical protein
MKVSLSASEAIEFLGICFVAGSTCAALLTWYANQLKNEILAECKAYLYVLQERIQANEIEIGHLNSSAEKSWPRFQRLILSIRRRDIDESR